MVIGLLQWDRASDGAEIASDQTASAITDQLQWDRASDGAEINPGVRWEMMGAKLQWDRASDGAEISTVIGLGTAYRCFNGTAPVMARKSSSPPPRLPRQ